MGASAFERLPPVLPQAGVVGRCEDGPGRAGGGERGSAAAHPKGKQRLACGSEESVHGNRSRTVLREEARPLDETLAREIEGLRQLKTKALRARYQELFGEETGSWNQAHLYRRMAWRLQAQALGGLSERAQRRAGELAEEASLRLRAPRPF